MSMQNQDTASITDTTATAITTQQVPYRFLSVKEVAEMVGLGVSTVWKYVKEGAFPQPFRITASCTRWKDAEVAQWMEKSIAESAERVSRTVHLEVARKKRTKQQ